LAKGILPWSVVSFRRIGGPRLKFVLFVEGYTERKAVPAFLKSWIDRNLDNRIGITPVRFDGWAHQVKDLKSKALMYLKEPGRREDVIAVISLLDLYGPQFYPPTPMSTDQRYDWGRKHLEETVGHPRFRQFFAVHEVEAWLLCDPGIFDPKVRTEIRKVSKPETVDFDEPPAKLLEAHYRKKLDRSYRKVVDGNNLFRKLDAASAYMRCPRLREMLDEMTSLVEHAGLDMNV
jgi:hypothetical protein